MRKYNIKLILCFLLFLSVGCHKEITRETDTKLVSFSKEETYCYPLIMDTVMVKSFSLSLPNKYSKVQGTKSEEKKVDNIKLLKETKWGKDNRSCRVDGSAENTLLDYIYIVNYCDGQGFAIVSSYDYNGRVLGYSDYGTLSDTTSNPGLQFYMTELARYAVGVPVAPKRDFIIDSGDTTYFYSFDHMFTEEEVLEEFGVNPFYKWNQGVPYNEDVSYYFGTNVLVGCVALAMCQALAYQRHPDSTYSHIHNSVLYFDWDDIQNEYGANEHCYDVSAFLAKVGFSIGTIYSSTESLATIPNVLAGIDSLGLTYDFLVGFNINDIEGSLMREYPVVMFGQTLGGLGHTWLAESVRTERIYVYYVYNVVDNYQISHGQRVILDRIEGPLQKLYYNWGWGGYGNGFFESNSFGYTTTQYNHNVIILSGLRPVFHFPFN